MRWITIGDSFGDGGYRGITPTVFFQGQCNSHGWKRYCSKTFRLENIDRRERLLVMACGIYENGCRADLSIIPKSETASQVDTKTSVIRKRRTCQRGKKSRGHLRRGLVPHDQLSNSDDQECSRDHLSKRAQVSYYYRRQGASDGRNPHDRP